MGINLPNGANVEEIVLPNGSQASEVIGPDGSTVWERVAIPDSGVSRWTFDDADTDGSTLVDSWGNNDGTINGATTGFSGANQTYTTSEAYSFDGSDDVVDGGFNPSDVGLGGSSAKSVALWAYTRSFDEGGQFQFGRKDTDGADFSLRTKDTTGEYRGQFWGDVDIDFTLGGTDEWHHFVVSFDGSGVTIYGDGTEVGSNSTTLNTSDHPFVVGEWDSDYFDGLIDDVRLYDKGLSAAEVSNLYQTGSING